MVAARKEWQLCLQPFGSVGCCEVHLGEITIQQQWTHFDIIDIIDIIDIYYPN